MSSHHRLTVQDKIHQALVQANNIELGNTTKVSAGTASGMAVYADSVPTPVADPNSRDGWLFTKTMAGTDKFNYYLYSEGNKPLTLGGLKSLHSHVSIDNWQSQASAPFFNVYTKMTGVGDAGSWYHSRITYAIDSAVDIAIGERIELYAKEIPPKRSIRQVRLNTEIKTGDCDPDEEIYTISLGSDSAAPASTQILVAKLGWSSSNINHVIKLID
jgi:hypothetical protein